MVHTNNILNKEDRKMKKLLGALLVIGGIGLGLYVGVWVFFVGGILDIIREIRAEQLHELSVAWGIVKIVLAGLVGTLSTFVCIIPGLLLVDAG